MCFAMGKYKGKKWSSFWRSSTTGQSRHEQHEMQERISWRWWLARKYSALSQRRPELDREPSLPYIWIQYGGEQRLKYRLSHNQQYHNITVDDIKQWCKQALHIPLCTMTVKYNGGYLKDDHATLESLGILPCTSQIDVFGDQVTDEQRLEMVSGDIEEVGACQIIKTVVGKNQDLTTRVTELEKHPQQQEEGEKQHLLQALTRILITLDGVECPSQFKTARQDRRQAIRTYQGLLERVEGLKSL